MGKIYIKDNIQYPVSEGFKDTVKIPDKEKEGGFVEVETTVFTIIDHIWEKAGYMELSKDIKNKIKHYKTLLTESDYKILKCYEASLQEKELPYELNAVIALRDGYRDKINELEEELKEYLALI